VRESGQWIVEMDSGVGAMPSVCVIMSRARTKRRSIGRSHVTVACQRDDGFARALCQGLEHAPTGSG